MPDRLQVGGAGSGPDRTLDVAGDVCYLNVQADGEVALAQEARGAALRLVRITGGYRAEPIEAGDQILVNGEELYCKDLESGDVVLLGDLRLRWLAATGPKVGSSAAGRPGRRRPQDARRPKAAGEAAPAARSGSARSRARSSGMPVAVPLLLSVLSVAAVLVVLEVLGDSGDTWTPQERMHLAREQLANGRVEQAQETLDLVMAEATGRLRTDAEQLRRQIDEASSETAARQAVANGEQALGRLTRFVDRYLAKGGGRPEARVLVRSCDEWLAEHGAPCGESPQGRKLLDQVRLLRQEYWGQSELPGPDEADDVIFAARARLRFMVRDYREAMRVLDAFGPGAPADEVEKVERAREEMLASGEVWLQSRLAMVERMIERNDLVRARHEMRALDGRAVLPQWEGLAAPVRARLE